MSVPNHQSNAAPAVGEATSDLFADSPALAGAPAPPIPGTLVGPEHAAVQVPGCTLISVLGQGGMGVVFLARQERLQRLVAVKMLTAEPARDTAYLARLEREAQTLATLSHPNIVGCHDILSTPQGTFLVMQFVPGQLSARDLLKRFRRLPEAVVARIALDTARGLAYALRKGVCHRDIKPDNLLVYREDANPPHTPEQVFASPHARVMLCDFGIARHGLTTGGGDARILGSPAYMAPEQAFDQAHADFRADLYALGSTLFHLLTGEHPFPGTSGLETIRMKLDRDLPDPRSLGVPLSAEGLRVLRHLGRRDPAERYASYADLLADLEEWTARVEAGHRLHRWVRHAPAFWKGLAAGLAVALLAGGGALAFRWRNQLAPRPASCAASLAYWSGERAAWTVTPPDAETSGPTLVNLVPGRPLELQQPIRADTRVRLRTRLPTPGQVRFSLRQDDGRERWSLRWARSSHSVSLVAEADGRDIPLVDISPRQPLEWLSLDLRVRERQVDLHADGRLCGIAPLKTPLGDARLTIAVQQGALGHFTDVWVTALR